MASSTLLTSRRKPRETTKSVTKAKKAATSSQFGAPASGARSSRRSGRASHSEASVVSTVTMSSTPRVTPPLKSPALKRGAMALVMMTLDERVGQRAFEAVADLDAHAALVRRHQQQDAVVLVGLAELPGAEEVVGVGLDLLPLQRSDGGDDELDAGLRLEIGELRLDRGLGLRREDAGLVDDAAGERREGQRRRERRDEDERDGEERACRDARRRSARRVVGPVIAASPHQNFTAGGVSAPSLAVNSAIGLLLRKKVLAQSTPGKVRSAVL